MSLTAKITVMGVLAFFVWIMMINFHAVDPGRAYRSATLSPWELKAIAKLYGIKTIINLRGVEKLRWFYKEQAIAHELGIDMVNIDMSSRTLPDRHDELKLVNAFEHAPKPILIHCWSGADRSGEAAAIYDLVVLKTSKQQALKMLGPRYMHFRYLRPAKDYFVRLFQGAKWLRSSYFPCRGQYRYYNSQGPDCRRPLDQQ